MLAQLTHGSVEDLLLAADRTHSAAERTILLRRVLKIGTSYAAYQVALRQYYVGDAEKIVCENRDYNTICQFALDIPGANVNRLGYAVAAMKEPAKAMMFARVFKPTDIQELQYVVALAAMEEQTAQMGVVFAMHVPGADVNLLQDAVIRSKSETGIYAFAAQVKGANLRVLEKAIEENMLTLAALWIAQEVKGIDHARMAHVLVQSGSTDECLQYATKVPFSPFQKLMQRALDFATTIAVVGDNETAAALYGFAEATKNVNQIGEIYNAIVDTRWDHVAQRIAKNFVWPGKRPNVHLVNS